MSSMKLMQVSRACGVASVLLLFTAVVCMASMPLPPEMEASRRVAELATNKDLITLALWVALASITGNIALVRWLLAQTMRQTVALERMASRPCMVETHR